MSGTRKTRSSLRKDGKIEGNTRKRWSNTRKNWRTEIPVLCDVFTCCESLDQFSIQLASGSIVNVADVCVRLIESGIANQALQAVAYS